MCGMESGEGRVYVFRPIHDPQRGCVPDEQHGASVHPCPTCCSHPDTARLDALEQRLEALGQRLVHIEAGVGQLMNLPQSVMDRVEHERRGLYEMQLAVRLAVIDKRLDAIRQQQEAA